MNIFFNYFHFWLLSFLTIFIVDYTYFQHVLYEDEEEPEIDPPMPAPRKSISFSDEVLAADNKNSGVDEGRLKVVAKTGANKWKVIARFRFECCGLSDNLVTL